MRDKPCSSAVLALTINIAAGLMQGFPISSSNSRTPVAASAGAQTQLANLVGAGVIALLLLLAPGLVKDMPQAALGAVVITACISFTDWPGMFALLRQRRVEFMLAAASFLGVVFYGVIEGIAGAIGLSLLIGTTVLMASIAFSFQRYFEYQIEEARKISQ